MNGTDEPDSEGEHDSIVHLSEMAEEESALDRTRAEYGGVDLHDEFQPVDEVELAEEGMQLDDPERLAAELDGVVRRQPSLDPDDIGWDLDAED